jgi:hypothetical protein
MESRGEMCFQAFGGRPFRVGLAIVVVVIVSAVAIGAHALPVMLACIAFMTPPDETLTNQLAKTIADRLPTS